MFMRNALLLFTCLASAAWAQSPHIYYRGVVNSGSFMAPGLPGAAIARGSTFSIFGAFLGPTSSPTLASYPLQTNLGGVTVTVKQGATSVSAIPVFVSPGLINAIMPSNTPLGQVSVVVNFNNSGASNPAPVTVVNSNFGILSFAGGLGPGVVQNVVSATSEPVNSLAQPATPGLTVVVWGTGLGPITGADNASPPVGSLPIQTEVFIGGVSAKVTYSGRTPCCAGIDEVVLAVPPNAPLGCYVPVYVRTGGTAVSNFVTMAITADGSPCSEPGNPMATALINGGSTARVMAARIAVHHDMGVATTNDTTTDVLGAYVAEEANGVRNFDPSIALPPAGTCTSYTLAGDFTQNLGFPPGFAWPTPTGSSLNAGAISIAGLSGQADIAGTAGLTPLGGAIPTIANTQNTLILNPGSLNVSGAGGADVGSFQATLNMPQPLTWTNRDQLQTITRSQGFTANWTGVAAGNTVFVAGAGADLPNNASSMFVCVAHPGDSSLTVPGDVLANMPAARTRLLESRGVIYVGEWPLTGPATFNATGLNSGFLVAAQLIGRTVMFQ
jgi:uncharacterized protein (TIGR03437 family)